MTHVERLFGEKGRARRRLGEEILQQMHLGAIHAAANQPRPSMNVFGSTCPLCCADVDDAAFLKTGLAACLFCRTEDLAARQSLSRWI